MPFRMYKFVVLLFVFMLTSLGWTQGEATMLFLRIPNSPMLNGMGRTGTALPTTDVHGFYFNPAQLGYASQTTNVAFQFYPSKTDWLPQFNIADMAYDSYALNLGYNFENISSVFPFSVGFGYMKGQLNYGMSIWTGEQGPDGGFGQTFRKDYFHEYAFAVGYNYIFNLYAGIGYKKIFSSLSPTGLPWDSQSDKVEGDAFDFGFLVTFPVLKLFPEIQSFKINSGNIFYPSFDFSLGYAQTNIGDKVSNLIILQADPLPRTAQFGFGFSAGLDVEFGETFLRAIGISWTRQADDMLVQRNGEDITYQKFLGDINIGKHLIDGESDDKVEFHQGFRFNFLDFFQYTWGNFNGPGWELIKTKGFGIKAKGVLKILSSINNSKSLRLFTDHFDIQYFRSEIKTETSDHPLNKTKYQGISIRLYGF